MTAVATWKFEDSAIDQLMTALIVGSLQTVHGCLWVLFATLRFLANCAVENWKPISKLALAVGITLVFATNPHLSIAAILIIGYARFGKKLHRIQ